MLKESVPETGEFNFMDYLLGLQVRSGEDMWMGAEPLNLGAGSEKEVSEAPVRSLNRDTSDTLFAGFIPIAVHSDPEGVMPGRGVTANSDSDSADLSSIQHTDQATKLMEHGKTRAAPRLEFGVDLPTKQVLELSREKEPQRAQALNEETRRTEGLPNESKAMEISKHPHHDNAIQKYHANVFTVKAERGAQQREVNDGELREIPSAQDAKPNGEGKEPGDLKALSGRRIESSQNQAPLLPFQNGVTEGAQAVTPKVLRGQESGSVSLPEVMERVETLVHRGGGEMTVSLSPPELGKLEIRVSTEGNRVEIEMHSENNFAKAIIENSLGDLRQSLQSQDLNLTRIDVFSGRESLNFQAQADASFGRQGNREDLPNAWRENSRNQPVVAAPFALSKVNLAGRSSGVDLRI